LRNGFNAGSRHRHFDCAPARATDAKVSVRADGLVVAMRRAVVRDSPDGPRAPGADGEPPQGGPLRRWIANPGAADHDVRPAPDSGAKADIVGGPEADVGSPKRDDEPAVVNTSIPPVYGQI
jgi:hypothetical protein